MYAPSVWVHTLNFTTYVYVMIEVAPSCITRVGIATVYHLLFSQVNYCYKVRKQGSKIETGSNEEV